jgi:pseudouridine-5'-phosphate glycosidase/pseudouridine kinase
MESMGLSTAGIYVSPESDKSRTAQYIAINDARKDLVMAMADMDIIARHDSAISEHAKGIETPPNLKWVVVDANLNAELGRELLAKYSSACISTAFEPVSVDKSCLIFSSPTDKPRNILQPFPNNIINLATPNQFELAAMHEVAKKNGYFESDKWWHVIDAMGIPSTGARTRFVSITNDAMTDAGIPIQTIQLLPFMPTILTKLGADGVLLTELLKRDDDRLFLPDHAQYILSRTSIEGPDIGGVYMRLFPAFEEVTNVVSVNGVGDTFLGVLIAGLAQGRKLDHRLINIAQRGATMSLRSKDAVSSSLSTLKEALIY